ncbi:MAG: Sec-independent protein translocase protein TatB [Pseudolabrys sp.]
MFNIGWSEIVVIGVVALIAIGPKELPGVLRTLGQAMAKVRRMAAEFQGQFQEAMREAEMADLKKDVEAATTGFTNFDPLADTKKDIEGAFEDKPALASDATPPAANASAMSEPTASTLPEIDIPLPEVPPSLTSADFRPIAPVEPVEVKVDASAEPAADKQAGAKDAAKGVV